MDTCTNVPDTCRKEKQRVRKGRCHPRETACGNKVNQLSEDGTLCCSGHEHRWRGSWHCGWPPSTSQKCIHSLIWSSRRGTWNAVWRRSPCGCFQTLWGWWLSNPAEEGWPVDNHPGETCRKTGWSWWRPPRASASRCCSWTSSVSFLTVDSLQLR